MPKPMRWKEFGPSYIALLMLIYQKRRGCQGFLSTSHEDHPESATYSPFVAAVFVFD